MRKLRPLAYVAPNVTWPGHKESWQMTRSMSDTLSLHD